MSTRRFLHMLQVLRLGDEAKWAAMGEQEFDEVVDEVLREVRGLGFAPQCSQTWIHTRTIFYLR